MLASPKKLLTTAACVGFFEKQTVVTKEEKGKIPEFIQTEIKKNEEVKLFALMSECFFSNSFSSC